MVLEGGACGAWRMSTTCSNAACTFRSKSTICSHVVPKLGAPHEARLCKEHCCSPLSTTSWVIPFQDRYLVKLCCMVPCGVISRQCGAWRSHPIPWPCCAWEALLGQEILWLLDLEPLQNWQQKRYKLLKHRSWTQFSFKISHYISQLATVAQSLARSPRKCICIRCRRFESPSHQSHTEFSHSEPSFCLN